MARNELAARYAGSLLGAGWVVAYPLVVLAIYAAVYMFIFHVRVPQLSPLGYVLYVFSGLAPFLMTTEAISLGVGSVVSNKFVLSNTVFPIDLVPPKAVLTSQGPALVGFAMVVVIQGVTGGLSWTVVFLPLLWGLYLLALIGVAWILSLLNIVFRDLQNLVGLVLMVMLIASPIAYTPDMVPRALRPLLLVNPFAYFVTAYQQVLVLGQAPPLGHFAILIGIAGIAFFAGGWFFGGAKRALLDYV